MKQMRLMKMLAGAAFAVALGAAFAQESTTTTTTTDPVTGTTTTESSTTSGAGTITAYTPGSEYITFRTSTTAELLLHEENRSGRSGRPDPGVVGSSSRHAGDLHLR